MATSSFFQEVRLDDPKEIERLIDTLERAKNEPERKISVKCETVPPERVKDFWDNIRW